MEIIDPSTFDIGILPILPFAERHTLPRKPGIYFVLDSNKLPLYIGRSLDLQLRWKYQHHLLTVFLDLEDIHIAYLAFDCRDATHAQLTLQVLEYSFIYWHKPLYNRTKHVSSVHWLVKNGHHVPLVTPPPPPVLKRRRYRRGVVRNP